MDVEKKLKDIISECGIEVNKNLINYNTDFIKDLGFSSINIVQLVVEIEYAFDIEILDDDLQIENLSSYKNLIELLKRYLYNKQYVD